MSAASLYSKAIYPYPIRLNKREDKVVETAISGSSASLISSHFLVGAVVATHISKTTDFAQVAVGDLVIHVGATAGNADFGTAITAANIPQASAVVGDLYVILRARS
jgi:hypothetical protein